MITDRWTPPARSTALRAGRYWDAVRVPQDIGEQILALLGEESGPVITDSWGHLMYWLVKPGAATGWRFRHVQILGETPHEVAFVGVPARHLVEGRDLHWHRPITDGQYLTDAERLHTALQTVTAELITCLTGKTVDKMNAMIHNKG